MSSNELIKLITDNNLQEIFCEFGMNYYTLIYFFEYERKVDFETFFEQAPKLNENVSKITGVICGYRIEEIEDPFGGDANDIPTDKIAENISLHIAEIL